MFEISARITGRSGCLSLNRPKALNALNTPMCVAMSAALLEWQTDDAVQAIIIDHEADNGAGRGFCAGGDIALVRRSALEDGGAAGRAFFMAEYQLNHMLFSHPKPVVTFMDGVTMGGGVGISLPANFRVATHNTLFAMPEGAIGLFADVGAGYYLPRLPGRIGQFLALTGARLDGAECLWAGLATHYLPSENLAEAKARIAEAPADTAAILDQLSVDPPKARLAGNAENIDRLFASDTLEGIIAALASDPSKWAGKELAAVTAKCPTSSKVSLRLLELGARGGDFAGEMRREYAVAARMLMRPDFAEGVRAVLVDKDNAAIWQPETPEQVREAELDAIFAPLPQGEEWVPVAG